MARHTRDAKLPQGVVSIAPRGSIQGGGLVVSLCEARVPLLPSCQSRNEIGFPLRVVSSRPPDLYSRVKTASSF